MAELMTNLLKLERFLHKRLAKLQKKVTLLEESLAKSATFPQVWHEGDLLKAHFGLIKRGMKSLVVWDWETNTEYTIALEPDKPPQEQLSRRFKQARKMERAISHLEKQLSLTKAELATWEGYLQQLTTLTKEEEIAAFEQTIAFPQPQKPKAVRHATPQRPYHTFISKTGVVIYVGRNAKGNDQLTFVHANGSDWWLHVQNFPGSHVVIKTLKGQDPDSETMADAMQLALFYSQAKERGEGEICLTQRKYLSRVGKQLGRVQVSKHKSVWVRFDPLRFEQLKGR